MFHHEKGQIQLTALVMLLPALAVAFILVVFAPMFISMTRSLTVLGTV